jgi:hypothetical protein
LEAETEKRQSRRHAALAGGGAGIAVVIAWFLVRFVAGQFGASQEHAQKADDENRKFIMDVVPANTAALTEVKTAMTIGNSNTAAQTAALQQQTIAIQQQTSEIHALTMEVRNATATQREAKGSVEKLTNELQQAKP